MKRLFIFAFLYIVLSPDFCLALDWKKLHNHSRQISLEEAARQQKKDPLSIEKNYLLGLVSLDAYQNKRAMEAFSDILKMDKGNVAAKWGKAEVLRRQHKLKESEELIKEEVLSRDKNFAPAYISLGYIKYLQMDFAQSAKFCAKVINLKEDNVDLTTMVRAHSIYAASKGMLAHYGNAWTKLTHFNAIRRHLKMAEKLDPEAAEVYLGWGSYYMLMPSLLGQNFEKARKLILKAIEQNPHLPETYVRLAQVCRKMGNFVDYERNIQKALDLDPGNELALDIQSGRCRFICLKDVE